jgi:quercetin 2,3-dioxygenase
LKPQQIGIASKNWINIEGRQAYLVQIEGTSVINDIEVSDRDGMEIVEETILIKAVETSHIIIIEMEKQSV